MSDRVERWAVVERQHSMFESDHDTRAIAQRVADMTDGREVVHLVELRDGERVVAVGEEAVERVARAIEYETYRQVAAGATRWENIARAVLAALTHTQGGETNG